MNLYRYVRNNPVNLVDPDGMSPDPPPDDDCPDCPVGADTGTYYPSSDGNTYVYDGNTWNNLNEVSLIPYSQSDNEIQLKGPLIFAPVVAEAAAAAETGAAAEVGILTWLGRGAVLVVGLVVVLVFMPTTANAPSGRDEYNYHPITTTPVDETDNESDEKAKGNEGLEEDTDDKGTYSVYITLRDVKATENMKGSSKTNDRIHITSNVDQPLYYVGITKNDAEDRYGKQEIQSRYIEVIANRLTKDQARGVEQWIIELNTGMKGYPARSSNLDNILNSTDPGRTIAPDDAYTRRKIAGKAVLDTQYPGIWNSYFNFSISTEYNNSTVKDKLKPQDRIKYSHLYKK